MAQAVPFHRSASVDWVPVLVSEYPTAVHARADVHDTPRRASLPWVLELGVGWMTQALPFHRSASVRSTLLPVSCSPAAVHAEADVHDTAAKPPDGAVAEAAAAGGVTPSIAPAPRATAAKTAACLPARDAWPKPVKIATHK
jgi:hypothetical protein